MVSLERFPVVLGLLAIAACSEGEPGERPDAAVDVGASAMRPWWDGGEDIPEYSLGRLLISHVAGSELTLFDLDTSAVAGTIPFDARAEVVAGGGGRYGYAYSSSQGALRVVDPGQWLLSHIDHFHVIRSEHALMAEQVSVPSLSSLLAHDGWITAYASSGTAAIFQERSITANRFAPTLASLAPAANGVAIVSRANLVASDGAALSQRSVLDVNAVAASFAGCTEPRGIAAQGERVFIGCAEGLLQLVWDAAQEIFVPALLPAQRVNAVATTDRFDGALLQIGTRTLGVLRGSMLQQVELGSDVVAFELRRQGNTALVLTNDGAAHEVDLQTAAVSRSTSLLMAPADGARLVLSHAYAYITDPRAPRVLPLRLRSMQLEGEFTLSAPAYDLALVGVPGSYTDDRE